MILGRAAPEWSRRRRDLLICTGGVTKNLEWRRLYPLLIQDIKKLHSYSWVDIKVTREGLPDPRPESRKVVRRHGSYLTEIRRIQDEGVRKWYVENLVRDCTKVMQSKRETMGIVKPIIESVEINEIEPTVPKTDENQTTLSLWASHPIFNKKARLEKWKMDYAVKPFEVRFKFRCGPKCQLDHHNMKVLDIEFFMLYRHVFQKYHDVDVTFQKMKEKVEKELENKDFYFVLGTHSSYPFLIYMIGSVIRIKKGVKAIKPLEVR